MLRLSFQGSGPYYLWMSVLTVLSLVGPARVGAPVCRWPADTGMTNQVSWGAYIANFTFLVGVAAGAVMLVIPAYIYKKEHMHAVVLFGELMAIAVIVVCLLFVTVDLGHPERFHHMIPPFGVFNFPGSILVLGRHRAQRLSRAQPAHRGLPPLLPVPHQQPPTEILHSVRVPLDRLGGEYPHRHGVSFTSDSPGAPTGITRSCPRAFSPRLSWPDRR